MVVQTHRSQTIEKLVILATPADKCFVVAA